MQDIKGITKPYESKRGTYERSPALRERTLPLLCLVEGMRLGFKRISGFGVGKISNFLSHNFHFNKIMS